MCLKRRIVYDVQNLADILELCKNCSNLRRCVKLCNMCRFHFFINVQDCAIFSFVKMLTIEQILQTPQNDVISMAWVTRLRGFPLPVI